ncbi:HlyD family efflux transporter periplasmic adaptor subunit [Glaciecola sp. SC05]|uniref:HlyD family efflux transporter periplasmic adaptor subunit n=1 Tax=Glaciecola sp. SC05 TaxID=1987355 RepID=UPI0035273386
MNIIRSQVDYTKCLSALSLLSMLLFNSSAMAKNDLLLTGQISSSTKQIVNAPQGSRWQLQIQWMEQEGKIVEQGNSVVVFDGAAEQAELTSNEENLDRLVLELEQLKVQQEQKVIDARGRLTVAKMRVEKATIEASVPSSQVAALEKGQFELELQRTMLEQVKAEEALQRALYEQSAELTKKEVNILQVKEQISYLEGILANLNVIAQVTGPVSYAIHPWFGTKLSAGMNVRASWKVLDVQSTSNFQIETWIHEIDAVGLDENTAVEITLDAYPNKKYRGIISNLSKQSERKALWSKSAYFPAIVTFETAPEVNLLPGMSVRILVDKAGGKNV